MCGRYTITLDKPTLEKRFHVQPAFAWARRYNVAPSQPVPVILRRGESGGAGRACELMRWGLVPHWADDVSIGNKMINARSETVAEKPAFRDAMKYRRCILPADGFYEWQQQGKKKQPHLIQLADGEPFAFAGLYEHWQDAAGNELESCAILTCKPNEMLAKLHNRMPVILAEKDYDRWLDPKQQNPGAVLDLLEPFPAEHMTHHTVSTYVNNPRHEDAKCIEGDTLF